MAWRTFRAASPRRLSLLQPSPPPSLHDMEEKEKKRLALASLLLLLYTNREEEKNKRAGMTRFSAFDMPGENKDQEQTARA